MKKVTAFGLVVCMLFTLLPLAVVAADGDTGLTEAILTVKERIAVPENYTEFTSETQEANGVTYYSLQWEPKSDDVSYTDPLRVEVSDRGDILNYQNRAVSSSGENQFSKYTGEELRDLAYTWLQQINPELMAEFPIENAEFIEGYSISSVINVKFNRMINGMTFCDDYFTVLLDGQTGEVVSMFSQYTYYQTLPSVDTVMEQEAAQEKFWALNPVSVKYTTSADPNRAVLVYAPKDSTLEMDAVTGEEVQYEETIYYAGMDQATAEAGASGGGSSNRLTESELANVEQVNGLLGKEELSAIAKGLENTGYADAEVESVYYSLVQEEEKEDRYFAVVTLQKDTGSANVRMDAKTGELYSFNSYRDADVNEETSITRETVEQNAAAFAEKYASAAFAKSKLTEDENTAMPKEQVDNTVQLVRYENDIPYDSNSLSLRVDLVTGEITSFYKSWTEDITFEDPAGLVGEETAKAVLLGQSGLTLKYLNTKRDNGVGNIILAYVLETRPAFVGGTSGQIVDYNGSVYNENSGKPTIPEDIAGHYGETAISMLIQSGILVMQEGEESFRPDDVITQKELLAFVGGLTSGSIYPMGDAEALRIAVRYGILSPENYMPEQEATRMDGVEYILHALGYAEIAELQGIYDSGFADRASMGDKEGYAAIAKGFGIVNGDENGYFHPEQTLTRADAAIMIYNYFMRG